MASALARRADPCSTSSRSRGTKGPAFALVLALVGLAPGCAGAGAPLGALGSLGPEATGAAGDEEPRRRPDGVSIDPASKPPEPRDRARVEDGFVTLRTPLGSDLALAAVRAFFRAVVREDLDAIEALLAPNAVAIASPGSPQGGQSPPLAAYWEQRFRRLDYGKLAGELVYREGNVAVFQADDASEGRGARIPAHVGPLEEDDVVVVVPIATPRVGLDRLLGDEIVVWLRREGDTYRIHRVAEDFQLP